MHTYPFPTTPFQHRRYIDLIIFSLNVFSCYIDVLPMSSPHLPLLLFSTFTEAKLVLKIFKVQGTQQPLLSHVTSWLCLLVIYAVSSGLKYKNIYIHCGLQPLPYTSQFTTFTIFAFVIMCVNVTLPQMDLFLYGLQLNV